MLWRKTFQKKKIFQGIPLGDAVGSNVECNQLLYLKPPPSFFRITGSTMYMLCSAHTYTYMQRCNIRGKQKHTIAPTHILPRLDSLTHNQCTKVQTFWLLFGNKIYTHIQMPQNKKQTLPTVCKGVERNPKSHGVPHVFLFFKWFNYLVTLTIWRISGV